MLSVTDIRNNSTAFKKLSDEVWGNSTENSFGRGKMISGIPLPEVIKKLNVTPDMTTNTRDPKEIMYIHKKMDDMDIYFVFNQQNSEIDREILFRVNGKTPEIWNPENGVVIRPAIFSIEKNQTRIPVKFKPYESKIFIFKNNAPGNFIKQVSSGNKEIFPLKQIGDTAFSVPQVVITKGEYRFTTSLSGDYSFTTNGNKIIKKTLARTEIIDPENLKILMEFFPISDEVIKPVSVTQLKSLTDFEDPAIKYFAGKVKYTLNFTASDIVSANDSIVLDLGNLSATAIVILNGKLLGYPWQSNTCIPVTGMLKADNKLEITVATVCRNRFIGDLIQYGSVKSLWTTSPIGTILNKDMPLKPSGLMGPLKLMGYMKQ